MEKKKFSKYRVKRQITVQLYAHSYPAKTISTWLKERIDCQKIINMHSHQLQLERYADNIIGPDKSQNTINLSKNRELNLLKVKTPTVENHALTSRVKLHIWKYIVHTSFQNSPHGTFCLILLNFTPWNKPPIWLPFQSWNTEEPCGWHITIFKGVW